MNLRAADDRGAVFVEKLIVYLPLLLLFFLTWEVAELGAASLVVQRASAAAGRAAMVVLADDPAFYGGESVGEYAGQRQADIELAAGMVLSATPKLGDDFDVELEAPSTAGQAFEVTVRAPYSCTGFSLLCGGSDHMMLTSTTQHTYQGARYQFTSPGGSEIGGGSQALTGASDGGDHLRKKGGSTPPGSAPTCKTKDCQKCEDLKAKFDDASQRLARWECVAKLNPGGENWSNSQQRMNFAKDDLKDARTEAQKACKACGGQAAKDFKKDFDPGKKSRQQDWGICPPKCDNNINAIGRINDLLPWRDAARNGGASKKVDVFDDFIDQWRNPPPGVNRSDWTLQINGQWINDRTDNGNIFYMASNADDRNMSDARFGCTAYAREIQTLINKGYKPYGNWWATPAQASKCFPGMKPDPVPNTHCPASEKNDPFNLAGGVITAP